MKIKKIKMKIKLIKNNMKNKKILNMLKKSQKRYSYYYILMNKEFNKKQRKI